MSAWAPKGLSALGLLLLSPGGGLGCAACPSSWEGCPAPHGELEILSQWSEALLTTFHP